MEPIKKILLRVTALVLVLAMTVGLVPQASAAVPDTHSTQEQLDYSFDGKTPLGSIIADVLSEEMAEESGADVDYNVTALDITDGVATVTFTTLEDAQLVVAVYTEDGMELLSSVNTTVTADMTEVMLTFDEALPQYFLAEAYLLDSYDFSPLCTPYEDVRHTQDMQELLASDIHDYDPELVLNLDESEDNNFAVFEETTRRITGTTGLNELVSEDSEAMVYTFRNADTQLTSLVAGDIAAYTWGENEMLLFKVAEIRVDGTDVTIRGGELALEEVFSHMKITGTSDPDTMSLDMSAADESVVYLGPGEGSDRVPGTYSPDAVAPLDSDISESWSGDFVFKLLEKETGSLTFSGEAGISVEVGLEVSITPKRRVVEFTVALNTELTFSVSVEASDGFNLTMGVILIPILPGIVDAAILPSLVFEFEASVSGTVSMETYFGAKITQKGFGKPKAKNLSQKPTGTMSFQMEGKVFFGVELMPTLYLLASGVELYFGCKGGLEINATLFEASDDDSYYHDCVGCAAGKAYSTVALETGGRLIFVDFEMTIVEKKIRAPKLDFYICNGHGEVGLGECPHVLRKITVKVKDENGAPIENAVIICSDAAILPSDDYTNSEGVGAIYLPKGKHEITVRKDDMSKEKTVKVGEEPKKVTFKLKPEEPEKPEEEEKNDALDGSGGDDYIDYGKSVLSGSCGDDLTWDLYEDGTLVIDGEGPMYDYEYDFTDAIETPSSSTAIYTTAPWGRHVAQITEIEMAEGITYIGARAFALVELPTSVEIPDSVTQIGRGAFANCVGLRSVYIGTGLECIEENAFCLRQDDWYGSRRDIYVDSLEDWLSITLENSESSPFTYYSGGYLYHGNNMSSDLYIPEGTTEIKNYAFYNCQNMEYDLEIPESVKRIGISALALTNLDSVSFTSGDLYVDQWGFSANYDMEEVCVPSLEVWLNIQFEGESANPLSDHSTGELGGDDKNVKLYVDGKRCVDLVIPDGIDVTGTYSFAEYYDLNSVTFPETLTQIPEGMFYRCTGLQEIRIPDSVSRIGEYAFARCSNLADVRLSDTLSEIGGAAFSSCSDLTGIQIPDSVSHIGDSAFSGCVSLTSVVIPNATIGENAFYNCEGLTDVTIQGGVDTIGYEAFEACSSLTNLTICEGVENIRSRAFYGCSSLKSIVIPDGVKNLGSEVFNAALEEVRFLGDSPYADHWAREPFEGVSATAYYPAGNPTWEEWDMESIGRSLTWVPYDPEEENARSSDISVCAAPEKPTVGTDAIHSGDYGSGELDGVTVKTADFDGLLPGAEYVLLVLASLEAEDRLASDNLLYIGHAAAAEDGTASFTYIPRTFLDRSIVVLCGPSAKDLKDAQVILEPMGCDGETWAVEPTVIYDGVTLIEGEDYELLGAVSYQEPGTYTFWIQGIHDYTGLVECTYTAADHIHEFTEHTADGNATCTEDGTKTSRCIHCDLTDTLPDPGSALGHAWDEGVVTIEPTEETEGEMLHTCTRCGETKTEILPKKEHVHEYEVVFEWPGSCQSLPFTVYECKLCGENYQVEGTEYQPHEWDAGVVTVEPTEETEGERLFTCTRCYKTKTEPEPRIHDCTYAFVEAVEPTCYDSGYSIYACTYCGATTEADYVDPLGHAWDEGVVTVEPTYEDWGEILYTCTRCGRTKTEYLPQLHEHRFYYYETVEPTCYSEGYTIYKCVYCDELSYDDYVDMIDHTWDEGVVTVEPTPETEGEMLYTCIYCDATRTEVLPKVHVHSYMRLRVVEPTCTEEGYTIYLCSSCGEVFFDDHTQPLGHSYGDWAEAGNGMEERVCQRCGDTEQRPIGGTVNPFTDVPAGSFYYDPVMWAVENGITNGTTATTFGPNDQCMRAHVVTFLWRAAGSPEPTSTTNPFVDVKPTDFYYKAVLWAVEQGVTNGVDATHFGPFAYCNRAQVVTFLYRSLGSPAVESQHNPFTDVPEGQWFTVPVLWAVENGVTNGLSATAFGPNAICNRAQIVTFLYRAFAE